MVNQYFNSKRLKLSADIRGKIVAVCVFSSFAVAITNGGHIGRSEYLS